MAHVFINIHVSVLINGASVWHIYFVVFMTITVNTTQILMFPLEAQITSFPLKHGFQVMISVRVSWRNPSVIGQLTCLVVGHQNEANLRNPW